MEWSERASGVDVGGSVTRIEYIPESGGNGEGGGRPRWPAGDREGGTSRMHVCVDLHGGREAGDRGESQPE